MKKLFFLFGLCCAALLFGGAYAGAEEITEDMTAQFEEQPRPHELPKRR